MSSAQLYDVISKIEVNYHKVPFPVIAPYYGDELNNWK